MLEITEITYIILLERHDFMKIVVVADTHKEFERYSTVVENNEADLYIHLGDGVHEFTDVAKANPQKKFVFVKGNCDFCEASTSQILKIGKCKILCVHGNEQNVSQGLHDLIKLAKKKGCNIALYGHTHFFKTDLVDGVYVMNPGSLSSPRGHNRPSYGVIEIDTEGTVKMNIVAY